ncbi:MULTISPECIES: hypothetical protein [Streptomyces]|uniref:hypothetical protein n=1 Tax=Streptomyces TaxID=1883 RepID=UPI00033D9603|nr:hypothetical protein [Streptomyces noursei]AKA06566.1 hypothetical protein SAZ_32100 [Streptomyces noursei ZPM]EOT02058.1 hypothetical protein K530_20621 [Streptomyces noursei CCRC 11814]MCE4944238.1 hypothetical protein [Streptomyces noursei]UWS75077.1 hypothetical protein N1H47_29850 [Streptomyces noursei]
MADSVPVRCPTCRRENAFTPPTFPCACGAPLTLPVLRGGVPVEILHRTWEASWVDVRCEVCGRQDAWPAPESGCACGTVVRVPVTPTPVAPLPPELPEAAPAAAPPPAPPARPRPATGPPPQRPAFRPVTIRTARDCITAAAQYLKWLGFTDVARAQERTAAGVDLRGSGVVAQVDPTTRATALREIECVWLNGLADSAVAVFFSLAGYARDARSRADELHVPLFVMDLTGTPQPVNDAADELITQGARPPG